MTRTLLVYGDSNSHGTPPMPDLDFVGRHAPGDRWPGVLAAGLPDWTVIAEGLPGRTTVHDDPLEGAHKNGLTVLPAILETHNPLDLVILKLGHNDLKARYGLPAQDIAFGAGKLVECVRRHQPQAQVLLIAPPPILESGCLAEMFGGGAAKSARFAALYAQEATRQGAAFLDAGQHIAVDPLDGIHYAAASHHALGRAVAALIRRLWPWRDTMLKRIDNRLTADVLRVLRAMGHGDVLILADTNFPADSVARATVTGKLLRMDNLNCGEAANAILSLFPLDTFVADFAGRVEVVGQPDEIPPVQQEVQAEIDAAEGRPRPMIGIERFAFYDMARKSYAVIQTGERRFYGCFMFRKGVIPPDA